MIDNSRDIKQLGQKEKDEYYTFIKSSVESGDYFKDAKEWYFIRYVSPLCQRTVLVLSAILAFVVLYCLSDMIEATFPLVEEFPVIITAKDQSLYYPHLVAMKRKDDTEVNTVDEAIAKYLTSIYIKDREEYDYSKSRISEVNKKFKRLRNTSSASEYRKFQLFMSPDNPVSPIHQLGRKSSRRVEIKSVDFIKDEADDFVSKAKSFLQIKLPTEAQVKFVAILSTMNGDDLKEEREEFVAKIRFEFAGASKDENKKALNFVVNSYQLFQVQK